MTYRFGFSDCKSSENSIMLWLWYSLRKPYCELDLSLSLSHPFPTPTPPSLTLSFSPSLPLKITDPKSKMYLSFYSNYTSKCFSSKFGCLSSEIGGIVFILFSEFSFSTLLSPAPAILSSMWTHHLCSSFFLPPTPACFFPIYCGPPLSPRALASTDTGSNSHSNLPLF